MLTSWWRSSANYLLSGKTSQRTFSLSQFLLTFLPAAGRSSSKFSLTGPGPVKLSCKEFQHIKNFSNGTIITNPPYGIRLGKLDEVKSLYKEFGDYLKTNCTGSTAFIYTGEKELRKCIGLKTSKRIHLDNGKLEGVLLKIDSYEGSRKKKWENNQS